MLGTALFDVAADSTVVFRHQQYAEFLAAEYVTGRPVTRGQLPVLLGMADDGAIPGSLAGVAAWIAALDPEPGGRASRVQRARAGEDRAWSFRRTPTGPPIVGTILAGAASGDADPLPGQDLRALAHPDLASQAG